MTLAPLYIDLAVARGCSHAVNYDTGCWEWLGPRNAFGYGIRQRGPNGVLAHRHYYAERHGSVPGTLDHLCRNTSCVNPDHLEGVSRGENVRRGARAKLDWDLVTLIRSSALGNTVLARQIGVSPSTVCNVRAERCWAEKDRPS